MLKKILNWVLFVSLFLLVACGKSELEKLNEELKELEQQKTQIETRAKKIETEYNKFKTNILPLVNFYIELYEMPESAKIEASSKSREELLSDFAIKITESDEYLYLIDEAAGANEGLVLLIDSVKNLGKREQDKYFAIKDELIKINREMLENIQKQQALEK
jgi:hypothetical protein